MPGIPSGLSNMWWRNHSKCSCLLGKELPVIADKVILQQRHFWGQRASGRRQPMLTGSFPSSLAGMSCTSREALGLGILGGSAGTCVCACSCLGPLFICASLRESNPLARYGLAALLRGGAAATLTGCAALHLWGSGTHKQHLLGVRYFGDALHTQTPAGLAHQPCHSPRTPG